MTSETCQCSIADCGKPVHAKCLCNAHYLRLLRYGNPLAGRTQVGKTLEFFENVVLPFAGDDCLIWPFSRTDNGYALIWHEGRNFIVSRLVCERIHGTAPTPEHHAAHTCGRGSDACVTPKHLRWATRTENEADKIVHGTTNRGEQCGSSKLTEADVREIRQMSGTQREIAEKFGVAQSAISKIMTGATWRERGVTHG